MVTLDELLDAGDEQRDKTLDAGRVVAGYLRVGIWSVGFVLAKLTIFTLTGIAGVIFAIGWTCARTMPVFRWARTAFMLGWEAGQGKRR